MLMSSVLLDISLYKTITTFDFPKWIFLVLLAVLLTVGVKCAPRGKFQEQPFSLETSKCIKGFCAVAIILHHLSQYLVSLQKADVLFLFNDIGVVFVGIFFFFSGYGLYTSLKSKDNYLKGFVKKRFSTILIPFYACIFVFVLFALFTRKSFTTSELIAVLTGWNLINSHMWYVVEIAILYLAFFVIYKTIRNRNIATIVMSCVVLLMTIGSLLLGHKGMTIWFSGEWWYNTTFLFIIGILVSKNEEAVMAFAKRYYKILLPVFIVFSIGLGIATQYALNTWSYWNEYPGYPGYKEKFLCLIIQLPWVICTTITSLLLMLKLKFGNRVLKFLGSISLELYLIHNLFLTGLTDNTIASIPSVAMLIIFTYICSIAMAFVLSGIDKYLVAAINKRTLKPAINDGRIHSFDVMRLVMSFFVVAIHVPFRNNSSAVIAFGKTAVPFFLVISGYLLYRDDTSDMMKRLIKQTKRIFILMIASSTLYGILYILISYNQYHSFTMVKLMFTRNRIIDMLLYNMPLFSEHLWFFGSFFYALIILIVLTKTKLIKKVMFIAPALIVAYVLLSWYGSSEYHVYRNALLISFPYLMMGMLIRRFQNTIIRIPKVVLWIAMAVLCFTNMFELKYHVRGVAIPFVSAEIMVYVIVLLCLKYKDFGYGTLAEKLGSKYTLAIYILHIVPVLFMEEIFYMQAGFVTNFGPVTIFIFTLLVAMIIKIKYFLPGRKRVLEK